MVRREDDPVSFLVLDIVFVPLPDRHERRVSISTAAVVIAETVVPLDAQRRISLFESVIDFINA